jgi:hypothetical protein
MTAIVETTSSRRRHATIISQRRAGHEDQASWRRGHGYTVPDAVRFGQGRGEVETRRSVGNASQDDADVLAMVCTTYSTRDALDL